MSLEERISKLKEAENALRKERQDLEAEQRRIAHARAHDEINVCGPQCPSYMTDGCDLNRDAMVECNLPARASKF